MDALQRWTSRGMLMVVILQLVYLVLDYAIFPDLRGNINNFSLGLVAVAFTSFFWWSYRRDAREEDRLDSELNRLRLRLEELERKKRNLEKRDW